MKLYLIDHVNSEMGIASPKLNDCDKEDAKQRFTLQRI
tara:strand:- start:33 stop:146 length:114 start_codon:yes stop_codon:yes gene_type:complete